MEKLEKIERIKEQIERFMDGGYENVIIALIMIEQQDIELEVAIERFEYWYRNNIFTSFLNDILSGEFDRQETDGE